MLAWVAEPVACGLLKLLSRYAFSIIYSGLTRILKMAKKRKVNKSEAVRDYYAQHPDAKPKAVSEALAERGIKVSPASVSTIKFQASKKGTLPASAAGRKGKPARSGGGADFQRLLAAKELVEKVGGVEAAKKLLDELAQVQI